MSTQMPSVIAKLLKLNGIEGKGSRCNHTCTLMTLSRKLSLEGCDDVIMDFNYCDGTCGKDVCMKDEEMIKTVKWICNEKDNGDKLEIKMPKSCTCGI